MDNSILLNLDHHRSRERIERFGEVFTPEQYVQQMLDLFDSKVWTDENVIFFEPSAGHGNIVLPILSKRIEALSKKYRRSSESDPCMRAVATALNTLWAVDICPLNIDYLRKRLFDFVTQHLISNGISVRTQKNREFISHVICSIVWQIQENEALSGLSAGLNGGAIVSRTKLGSEWNKKNGHKQISFNNDWCSHFRESSHNRSTPMVFERARRFVDAILTEGAARGFGEFNFARPTLEAIFGVSSERVSGVA